MAQEVINNKYHGSCSYRVWSANGTIRLTGNATVSNIAMAPVGQTEEAIIAPLWLTRVLVTGLDTATWQVSQGNSTVNSVVGFYGGNLDVPYNEGRAIKLTGDNLYVTSLSGTNSMIQIEIKKP